MLNPSYEDIMRYTVANDRHNNSVRLKFYPR